MAMQNIFGGEFPAGTGEYLDQLDIVVVHMGNLYHVLEKLDIDLSSVNALLQGLDNVVYLSGGDEILAEERSPYIGPPKLTFFFMVGRCTARYSCTSRLAGADGFRGCYQWTSLKRYSHPNISLF